MVRGVFMTYKKKICLEKSMITSTSNQQMKNLMLLMKKAKARNEQELFVVEGRKMFQEVPEEWLKQVYVSESFFAENDKMLAGYTYEIVSDSVFKAVSDTQTPQGILCLVRKPQYRLEELLKGGRHASSDFREHPGPGKSWDDAAHRRGRRNQRCGHESYNRRSFQSENNPFNDGKYLPHAIFCDQRSGRDHL